MDTVIGIIVVLLILCLVATRFLLFFIFDYIGNIFVMKTIEKLFFIAFLLIVLGGCDMESENSLNYKISKWIAKGLDSNNKDLGDGYVLSYDGKYHWQIINSKRTIMIERTILSCTFDSMFILATQRPYDRFSHYDENYRDGHMRTFEESNMTLYWIINKKEEEGCYSYDDENTKRSMLYSNVYGPFDHYDYLRKRKELGVHDSLKLKYNPRPGNNPLIR
jgi:hypothetical protein